MTDLIRRKVTLKDFEEIRRLIASLNATERYLKLVRSSFPFEEFINDAQFASGLSLEDSISKLDDKVYGKSLAELATSVSSDIQFAEDMSSHFPKVTDQITQIARAYEPDFQIWKNLRENALTSLDIFNDLASNLYRQSDDLQKLLKPAGAFAELISNASELSGLVDSIQVSSEIMSATLKSIDDRDDDDTIDEYDNENTEFLLPGDIRRHLIESSGLPLVVIHRLLQDPVELYRCLTNPRLFEHLVAQAVETIGAEDVEVTPRSGDGGIDIFATFQIKGFRVRTAIECKRQRPDRPIKAGQARDLVGACVFSNENPGRGILCTTSDFQPGAKIILAQTVKLEDRRIDFEPWTTRDLATKIKK